MIKARWLSGITIFLVAIILGSRPGESADYFLVIGGGYSPKGNQVSLENNVAMLQSVVAEVYSDQASVEVLYSDGSSPNPDVQFLDPSYEIPRANLYLARLYGQEGGLKNQYRNHHLTNVRGAATRQSVEKWFDDASETLRKGDRLFIYVTTHGGRSNDKKRPFETNFYVWNHENFRLKEFVAQLDRLPASVDVVLVMVQCYAGGFSHAIFNDGDANKGPTNAARCGFFATVHDRVAAGCTPDIDEANYQEYSSYFWAALRGKTRTGEVIEPPDYDKDGRTSLAEAHAYALLASHTIDISIKTSDAFLRAVSKQRDNRKNEKSGAEPKDASGSDGEGETDDPLLTAESPVKLLLRHAAPYERAVVEGLRNQLGLEGDDLAAKAKSLADKVDKEKNELDKQRKNKRTELDKIRKQIRTALHNRWPEFENRWSPKVTLLLHGKTAEIERFFESQPKFSDFMRLHDEVESLSAEKLEVTRRWAKCKRLLHALETLALSANLPHVATEDVQTRYAVLVQAENASFGPDAARLASENATATDVTP